MSKEVNTVRTDALYEPIPLLMTYKELYNTITHYS